ncbi:hypothetical protein ACFY3G_35055 [Streptomyces phaeochromogenes]|uniref:hypothetical protein n=1 Tax=Streptomyces phaeochromogenes TaxID=1923 RepID=UPI0036B06906
MDIHSVRAMYEASAPVMAAGASRAYVRALVEHQAAALAGDPDARHAIGEARALFALAAPELEERRYADREQRRMYARRSIA